MSSSRLEKTPPEGYVPWTPPGAPPATRMRDAVRPLVLIGSAALVVALLVAWASTRSQERQPLPPVVAGGGVEGRPASLLIDSEPVGAEVWVNNDSVGVTPAWLDKLAPGVVEVVLHSDGITHDTTLALKPGQEASILIWLDDTWVAQEPQLGVQGIGDRPPPREVPSAVPEDASPSTVSPSEAPEPETTSPALVREASPTGRLQVTTVPEGASVWIGGERLGTTPLSLDALPAGERLVELRLPGYESERLRLTLAPNELTSRSVELRARPGIVTLVADAGSQVFVNGTLEGTVQNGSLRLSLAAGRYEVRVFHPERGEAFQVIEVAAGTAQRYAFEQGEARGTERTRRRTGW